MLTVLGVPLHPLVVHAVVVLVPLATLASLAVAFRPRWNRNYAPLAAVAALLGALSAVVAKLTGDQLEAALPLQGEIAAQVATHGRLGLWTLIMSWPFAVFAAVTAYLGRREDVQPQVVRAVALVAAAFGLVVTGLTVLAGHAGATAVWGFVADL